MRWWVAIALGGCGAARGPRTGVARAGLDAYCDVDVIGVGTIDFETDYLPHVIQCENGGAGLEALKAQAVASRSYAYYKIETSGAVADGTSDQVYSCGADPLPEHYAAVEATSGQVLTYMDLVVAAFFVAGADPSDRDTCVATGADDDPTNTEQYVTYNEGLSGDGLEQTTLGWVDPGNYRNRGCMSQWGARCLCERGEAYDFILCFYYGEDIGLVTAEGACVVEPEPMPDAGAPATDGAESESEAEAEAESEAESEAEAEAESEAESEAGAGGALSGGCGCALGAAPWRTHQAGTVR